MDKKAVFLILVFFLIYMFVPVHKSFSNEKTLNLSLEECIDHGLRENLNLKSYHLGLRSYELSIVQAESNFDPSLSLRMTHDKSATPNYYKYYDVSSIERDTSNLNFSIGQMLSTGADWGFGVFTTRSKSNIETAKNYTSYLGFSINQPLLKGRGKKVTRSNVYLAHISNESAFHDVENRAIELVYNLLQSYWNLVYARETLSVNKIALVQADSLLAYNQKGYELGILTESDVLEAKSQRLLRQQEIMNQENVIRDSEDVLKRLLNITTEEEWSLELIPTNKPDIKTVDLDPEIAVEQALKYRPDYKMAEKTLEQNEIYLTIAKNAQLPSLNLNASYNIHGSGTSLNKDLRDLSRTDAYGWQLGLNLSYPFQNRDAKADYEKRQIEIKRTRLALEDIESQIMTEIRSSIRNVNINSEKIEVARLSVEVNELKLKMEEERFKNQLSTSYYVLQFQNDLVNARNGYNKSLIDYTISVVEFQRACGTLLDNLNISIIPDE